MTEQYLNRPKVGSSVQHVCCKAMAEHMRIHSAQIRTASCFLHDALQCATGQWAIRLRTFKIESLEIFVESASRLGVRHGLCAPKIFATPYASIAIIAPVAAPNELRTRNVAPLLWADVLEQVPSPSLTQIFEDGSLRERAKIDDTFLAFTDDLQAAFCKINLLDTDVWNFTGATTGRVEKFNDGAIPPVVRSCNQFLDSRLRKCFGQSADRGAPA